MDQKKWNTQEFQMTIVDSKIYGKHLCLEKHEFFFSFRCHISFQFNTWGHESMSYCSTKLPDWHKLCDTMLVSGIEMREICILVWNIPAIWSHSRPFDSMVQRSHIIQSLVMDWQKDDWLMCDAMRLICSHLC